MLSQEKKQISMIKVSVKPNKKVISPCFLRLEYETIFFAQVNSKKWTRETKKNRKSLCYYIFTKSFKISQITDVEYIEYFKDTRNNVDTPAKLEDTINNIDHLKSAILVTESEQSIQDFLSEQHRMAKKKILNKQILNQYLKQLDDYIQLLRSFIAEILKRKLKSLQPQQNEMQQVNVQIKMNHQDLVIENLDQTGVMQNMDEQLKLQYKKSIQYVSQFISNY